MYQLVNSAGKRKITGIWIPFTCDDALLGFPCLWITRMFPINGLNCSRPCKGNAYCIGYIISLHAIYLFWITRYEKRSPAIRKEPKPFFVFLPGNVRSNSNAIGIALIKNIMLRDSEG